MAANKLGTNFSVVYPDRFRDSISKTSSAEEVFVGYKFCGNLQKFLLDYASKLDSQIPLSDEVNSNDK